MLSETWLDNDERVSMPNFDFCVQFKRPGRRAAGVTFYRKQKNSHVVTPHMNITYRQTSGLGIVSNDIGGPMCGEECLFENEQTVISVVAYIS
ncbi:uncharacterized protein TNCV_3797841 [Trichonephila clavipes]|nr:uncharacterized protein TNCV_3797841 [Trichonephila clavipes]